MLKVRCITCIVITVACFGFLNTRISTTDNDDTYYVIKEAKSKVSQPKSNDNKTNNDVLINDEDNLIGATTHTLTNRNVKTNNGVNNNINDVISSTIATATTTHDKDVKPTYDDGNTIGVNRKEKELVRNAMSSNAIETNLQNSDQNIIAGNSKTGNGNDGYDNNNNNNNNNIAISNNNSSQKFIGDLPEEPFSMKNYDSIFFYHSRKAGGTTMRRFLESVAKKHNLEFSTLEGYVMGSERFQNNNHTLFITSMRDPIDRAVSSYWFEGRWPNGEKHRTKANALDFMDYVAKCNAPKKNYRWEWFCVSDCFTKWFGGKESAKRKKINVKAAYSLLKRFHLIVRTEYLDDPTYAQKVQSLFDADDISIQHQNEGNIRQAREQQKLTSGTAKYQLTQVEMDYLQSVNQNDLELLAKVFGEENIINRTRTVVVNNHGQTPIAAVDNTNVTHDNAVVSLPSANKQKFIGNLPQEPFSMKNYDSIFFYHSRKAGGTTLREFLTKVAKKHNLELTILEGYVMGDERFKNTNSSRTLFITTMRDPVDRAVSSYWFEGRWPEGKNVNRTKETALDFMDYVAKCNEPKGNHYRWEWFCVSDCFCKWFGGKEARRKGIINVASAYQLLKHFHLILRTENLEDPTYAEQVQTLLDAQDINIRHQNEGSIRQKQEQANSTATKYQLTQVEMDYLRSVNQNDFELLAKVFGVREDVEKTSHTVTTTHDTDKTAIISVSNVSGSNKEADNKININYDKTVLAVNNAIGSDDKTNADVIHDNAITSPSITNRKFIGDLPEEPFSMKNYDSIFFYHTRKAGGTTLRQFLERVANKHNITFSYLEGYVMGDDPFNDNNHHNTLFITAIRDPVDRAISSYWFEGRWPHEYNINRTKENALDFMDYVAKLNNKPENPKNFRREWYCVSDCFCKWFGDLALRRQNLGVNVTSALKRLERFDLVLRMEQFRNQDYKQKVQRLLQSEELHFGHVNKNRKKEVVTSDYKLSESDMNYLRSVNQNDYELLARVFGSGEDLVKTTNHNVVTPNDIDKTAIIAVSNGNDSDEAENNSNISDNAVVAAPLSTNNKKFIGELPEEPFSMKNYDSIFFYHSRKAGGTTLRQYLANVAKRHNLTFSFLEGYVMGDEPFNKNNKTLFITAMRDPVDRAISSYWFEGRWPNDRNVNRTKENALDFMGYVDKCNKPKSNKEKYRWEWLCVSDCFCKWFGDPELRRQNITEVTSALQRLERFDLVLRMERFEDQHYKQKVQALLQSENFGIGHSNKNRKKEVLTSDYELSESDINYLKSVNQKDYELLARVFGDGGVVAADDDSKRISL